MNIDYFVVIGVTFAIAAVIAGKTIDFHNRYGEWMFRLQKLNHYWRKPWH